MAKVIVWTDVESTGTSSDVDALLEVAVVVTDFQGKPLLEPYNSLVTVKNLREIMTDADGPVKTMHERSGLWNDLWNLQTKSPELIDQELEAKISSLGEGHLFLLGGNSPWLDRRFTELYLPRFYRLISHMTVDVTTLSLVLQDRAGAPMFLKGGSHRALADVWDSIEEYKHYLSCLEQEKN